MFKFMTKLSKVLTRFWRQEKGVILVNEDKITKAALFAITHGAMTEDKIASMIEESLEFSLEGRSTSLKQLHHRIYMLEETLRYHQSTTSKTQNEVVVLRAQKEYLKEKVIDYIEIGERGYDSLYKALDQIHQNEMYTDVK